ncbi:MAG: hypothetical protein ACI90V_001264 [Bacillariaceae sp.]|jgi:hypothetical protein
MDSNASLVMIGCPSGRSFNEKSSRYELSMVEKKERITKKEKKKELCVRFRATSIINAK